MDKYVVEITDEALIDLDGIYNYIANTLLAPENAMGQFNRIATAILTLESFPERYPIFEIIEQSESPRVTTSGAFVRFTAALSHP